MPNDKAEILNALPRRLASPRPTVDEAVRILDGAEAPGVSLSNDQLIAIGLATLCFAHGVRIRRELGPIRALSPPSSQ